ncbi:component of DNA helicase/primase complex [Bovine herpesvirus type 1.1 (strain Cooper)]|uniref:Protein associated with DNA helicase/primase complex n=2 Tax=Bovine herpesvirus 1 TaxID=10320 RepID=Q65576_BHV1|nr:component of DNA helicase/primase complex [Bovine herpesvirus type 1.1]CAA88128.1 protein associated with DNA helicase/primase complex [Bovine alphaherpesvirus 1]
MEREAFSAEVFLNFTSMHEIQPIVKRIRQLEAARLPAAARPPLGWFRAAAAAESPLDFAPRELPFAAYLITGNAGSGKSTCIQTLSETLDCVITGATRVAAQNVYLKLAAAYHSRHINTIFQEFGFRANHVQAQLGRHQYVCAASPPSIQDVQFRDLVYYWEVLGDISRRLLGAAASRGQFEALRAAELAAGRPRGAVERLAPCVHGSLPAFARSNVIVIDEAGLLGRHILTAVVYCWWLINAAHDSAQYRDGAMPVVVCVGSPTQTDSLESTFEHHKLKCRVRSSENVLTCLITNPTLREYAAIPHNWTIFINNKRCQEYEFGELLKTLEYGLPVTEEHLALVDKFVVPDAFINNPANLQGWTRLYSSHREVSAYMSRLHAHLKVAEGRSRFVVFTLPVYTFVNIRTFEDYRTATGQPGLGVEKWLQANSGRITNYSQSRDQDAQSPHCEVCSAKGLVVARSDVTYVLNSQVTVTTRLKKLVFGFSGTFADFIAVLRDDGFVRAQSETSVEYAYQFLAALLFGGMIAFYNFLRTPGLDPGRVDEAYRRLARATQEALGPAADDAVDWRGLAADRAAGSEAGAGDNDDDLVFAALDEGTLDLLYCNYEFQRPTSAHEIYAQFLLLKNLFAARFDVCRTLFGAAFADAPFEAYVDNLSFKGCEVFTGSLRGGLVSMALQTDTYTLMGYAHAPPSLLSEEPGRRRLPDGVAELLSTLDVPNIVVRDQRGFVSVLHTNVSEFVEALDDKELEMAVSVDYGISSKLAMTIARSQGLSLDKVAVCFARGNLRLNAVYVALSRSVSSRFLRMNLNPLREPHERDTMISEHILAALRDENVHIVY